jgi:hypothetical protein
MTIVGAANGPPDGETPGVTPGGLLLHKFVKADSWRGALTTDATGENLPRNGSAWIYAKEVVVSPTDRRVGATIGRAAMRSGRRDKSASSPFHSPLRDGVLGTLLCDWQQRKDPQGTYLPAC